MTFIKEIIVGLHSTILSIVHFLNFITLGTIVYFLIDHNTYRIISCYPFIEDYSSIYLLLLLCINIILFAKKYNNLIFKLVTLPFTMGIFVIFKLFYMEINKSDILNITHWIGIKRVWSPLELQVELDNLLSMVNLNLSEDEKIKIVESHNTMDSLRYYVKNIKLEQEKALLNNKVQVEEIPAFNLMQHLSENYIFYTVSTIAFVAIGIGIYSYMSNSSSIVSDVKKDISDTYSYRDVITEHNNEIVSIKTHIASLKSNVVTLKTNMTSVKETLEDLVEDAKVVAERTRGSNTVIKLVSEDLTALKIDVEELKDGSKCFTDNLKLSDFYVKSAIEKADTAQSSITELKTEIIKEVMKEIDATDDVVSELSDKVDILLKGERIARLENGITAFLVYLGSIGVVGEEGTSLSEFIRSAEETNVSTDTSSSATNVVNDTNTSSFNDVE